MVDPTWMLAFGALVVVVFLVVSLSGIMARARLEGPRHGPVESGPDVSLVEQRLLRALNERRARSGRADPVGIDPELEDMARQAAYVRAVAAEDAGETLESRRRRMVPRLVGPLVEVTAGPARTGPDPDQAAASVFAALAPEAPLDAPQWTRAGIGVAHGEAGVTASVLFSRRMALLDAPLPESLAASGVLPITGESREGAFSDLRLAVVPPSGTPRPVPLERTEGGRFRAEITFPEGPGEWALEWSGEGVPWRAPIRIV